MPPAANHPVSVSVCARRSLVESHRGIGILSHAGIIAIAAIAGLMPNYTIADAALDPPIYAGGWHAVEQLGAGRQKAIEPTAADDCSSSHWRGGTGVFF